MNKQFTWKFGLVVAVAAVALYSMLPLSQKIKLGLDLKGGTSFLLKMDLSKVRIEQRGSALQQAIEVIRKRVDKFGVGEPVIQAEGQDRIVVQIPGLEQSRREEARKTIERTAFLEFRLVHPRNEELRSEMQTDPAFVPPVGYQKMVLRESRGGQRTESVYFVKIRPELTGKHVKVAYPEFEATTSQPSVGVEFDKEGAAIFGRVTSANVQHQLAIVLDGVLYSAPVINEPIMGGRCQISGRFTALEATQLANVLENPLEAPVKIMEERGVDPSLGADSIRSGVTAAVIGSVLVVVFMAVYYLAAGVVADLALVLNIVILVGVLAMFKFTLTLPGIAGVVLTIGMAVDANVLIYERVREELAANKPLRAAIAAGYQRAFIVIFDSNFTTIMTALILIWLGSGPVKGFGVTLTIGLLANLFAAVFVTRLGFDWLVAKGWLKSFKMLHVFRQKAHINFLGIWKIAFTLSWAIIIAGMVMFLNRGGLNLGQKTVVDLSVAEPVAVEKLQQSLDGAGISVSAVQYPATASGKLLRFTVASDRVNAVAEQLAKDFPAADFKPVNTQRIVGEVYGIDFKGGDAVTLSFGQKKSPTELRTSLEGAGLTDALIQYQRDVAAGGTEVLTLRLPEHSGEKAVAALEKDFPDAGFKVLSTDQVGAMVGGELLKQALWAVAASLIAIMIYVAVRFGEFSYGLGALVSLIHDVLMTIGLYCIWPWPHRTFSMPVVAAVLTLIGYSINDTIVVFDRIRENKKLLGGRLNYFDLINRSVNETLARTILTAGTVFLCAVALYGFGGRVLNDFAFCFVVGVLTGTYSSIYIASPCVLWYHRKEAGKMKAAAKKPEIAQA